MHSTYWNWDTTNHRAPQKSILGPMLFLVYVNDLPPTLNASSIPIIFVDETSVLKSSKSSDDFFILSYKVLSQMNKCFLQESAP